MSAFSRLWKTGRLAYHLMKVKLMPVHSSRDINEYIQSLLNSKRIGSQVVYHKILPASPPLWSDTAGGRNDPLNRLMKASGIQRLYSHQAQALDLIRSGRHVVTATPTASGKTLIYNLPVLERMMENPGVRALYMFPLKALAQDQLAAFNSMAASLSDHSPRAAIYDGDTSAWHRKRIRENPPNVLMTNPEMLHLAFLPHHWNWADFFSALEYVVIDEVHTYRGVLGSHMAQVLRRFKRICSFYGSRPTFIFSSATIANPAQLAHQLTGMEVVPITKSGSPKGHRHVVFIDPVEGSAQTTIMLLKAALHRGLRTIVYTQSRKYAELISLWAGSKSGRFASRISSYRAGYLPEERREIERKLADGELLAVISTSALELGIDIGDLDLCILAGYPGSVSSTLQRGGRVGRSGQDSAMILIAGDDALDQYFMRNPGELLGREPEAAVINPYNAMILEKHLACAAAELPLKADEPWLTEPGVLRSVLRLEQRGDLLRGADGSEFFSRYKSPHRHVDLRGSGSQYHIICSQTGESRGDIDAFRAFKETHPGAIYLHNGETYQVDHLGIDTQTVKITRAHVDYYTRVRSSKDTEILEVLNEKTVRGIKVSQGRLKVTDQVTGYERWRIHPQKKINIAALDLPPLIFETEGIWFNIPPEIQHRTEQAYLHFMGGIHAIEHAAIGIFPLLVLSDRNDLGGISIPYHEQVGMAAVFIYDGIPGGAGLSRQAFDKADKLLDLTRQVIEKCPCENGCPSCVHSPKCGSGNRPIDKGAAFFILNQMKTRPAGQVTHPDTVAEPAGHDIDRHNPDRLKIVELPPPQPEAIMTQTPGRFAVLDIETQRSAQEVGGWNRADLMRVSCVVVYDSYDDKFHEYLDHQIPQLIEHLTEVDLVIGFNILRFDYQVLAGYSDFAFKKLPTLDLLDIIFGHLGYRLSLDHLARETLGAAKSGDGLQALKWWKEGRMRDILDYCRMDVKITRDLYLYGKTNGFLLFQNKSGHKVRIPAGW